jgi:hypothetical protein
LTNWDALLANCEAKAEQFFHQVPFEYPPVNCWTGDTLRPTVTFANMGVTMRLAFQMMFTVSIRGAVLLITEQGLAHIGLLDDREQIYFELPPVWQYHDSENDDALSISVGREQEVSFMYALAGM